MEPSSKEVEEGKFDWQVPGRQAPREDTAGGVSELKDQPFGVEVRNTKCFKCGKWGHVNTDKIVSGKALSREHTFLLLSRNCFLHSLLSLLVIMFVTSSKMLFFFKFDYCC